MSDLIERQAAIDAAIEAADGWDGGYDVQRAHMIEDAIKTLPSAQPAPCEFCKHNNIADDKVCLMCSAERRTDEGD